ncbi:MAG: bifunctional oligoribonuclease/PAP phosphatase NrnA [Flavobacteriales bacterium]
MDKVNISKARVLINNATNIVVTAHKNPDGDAVGSSLALYHFLKNKGKNVKAILPNSFPDFFDWLPESEQIILFDQKEEEATQAIAEAELIFALDYNALHRTGDMKPALENSTADFILIDHHQQPDEFTVSFSDVSACSTGQMIFQFCNALEENLEWITNEISQSIYTGIMTDSGSFRFPSVTAETHRIVATLQEHGLEHAYVHQNVYDTNLMGKLQLLGHALSNKLEIIEGTKAAMISLSRAELDKYGYKPGDTEGLVNYALSLAGVNMAVLVKEGNNIVKLSFRSKGEFDVNTFARTHFGGGGHKNAAGGASFISFEDTVKKIKETVSKYTEELEYA